MVKGGLILAGAIMVGLQIAWRLANPTLPIFEGMGLVGGIAES